MFSNTIAHILYKGKYIGSLYYEKLDPRSAQSADLPKGVNPDNPLQNNTPIFRLTGKGNYDILKQIVQSTKGVIEDEAYLKTLPKLLNKNFKVKLESRGVLPHTNVNAESSPEAVIRDIELPDRRTY